MKPSTIEEISKTIVALTSKAMRLEARCDALEVAIGVLAKKTHLPEDRLWQAIDEVTAASFQKRLERVESSDPATAAALDYRRTLPDLPDELL